MKGIGSPLLLSVDIVIFDQKTGNEEKEKKISLEPRLSSNTQWVRAIPGQTS